MEQQKIRGHPPWYARGTPVIKMRDGPIAQARGKPPLKARGKPPLIARGKPPLNARGKPPLKARGKPPLENYNSPKARGKPPLRIRGKPRPIPHTIPWDGQAVKMGNTLVFNDDFSPFSRRYGRLKGGDKLVDFEADWFFDADRADLEPCFDAVKSKDVDRSEEAAADLSACVAPDNVKIEKDRDCLGLSGSEDIDAVKSKDVDRSEEAAADLEPCFDAVNACPDLSGSKDVDRSEEVAAADLSACVAPDNVEINKINKEKCFFENHK